MPETFSDISSRYVEGVDYRIIAQPGLRREFMIAAIHAGYIQEHVGAIAKAVAGDKHGLYLFEGLAQSANQKFYLRSDAFDEPRFNEAAGQHQRVISLHDLKAARGPDVLVGGRDKALAAQILSDLEAAQMPSRPYDESSLAFSPQNVCNRSARGEGVQIEIPRVLRDDEERKAHIIEVIKKSLDRFLTLD